jgi:KUP system potassium uptake protein
MCVWFAVIAIAAVPQIVRHPEVLLAFNPALRVSFMLHHGMIGFVTLARCFSPSPARKRSMPTSAISASGRSRPPGSSSCCRRWRMNYLGQGALLIGEPKAIENPFFLMFPGLGADPDGGAATAATVIASQAVITGAYSLTRQAIQLGLMPRFEIRHTSEAHSGQIYIPRINMLLFIAVMLLVAAVPVVRARWPRPTASP